VFAVGDSCWTSLVRGSMRLLLQCLLVSRLVVRRRKGVRRRVDRCRCQDCFMIVEELIGLFTLVVSDMTRVCWLLMLTIELYHKSY